MSSRPTLTFEQARGWNARRRTCGRFFAAVLSAAVSSGILLAQGATPAAAQSAVELPVAFQVKNTNTSPASCSSGLADGATYTIRGHISGPPAALASGKAELITIYLFGYEAGEWNWDLKGVPGYDYASEVAKKGQVSLTLDELGYGASGHPANGNETCEGAEADITHQIIQKLRHREYTLGEYPAIATAVARRLRAVAHQVQAKARELALATHLRVGQPDRRHEITKRQLGQHARVDLVGLARQRRESLDALGVGDEHVPALRLERVVDKPSAVHRLDDRTHPARVLRRDTLAQAAQAVLGNGAASSSTSSP